MRRKRNLGRTLFLVLAGLFAAAILFLRTEYVGEEVCKIARRKIPELTGLEVGIGRCALDPLRGGVEITGFNLSEKGAEEPLVAVDRALVRVRAFDVITGRIRVERIELDRPRVNLDLTRFLTEKPREKKKQGCPLDNLSNVELDGLTISGGLVHLRAPDSRGLDVEDLDVDVRHDSRGYDLRLTTARGELDTGVVTLPLSRLKLSSTVDLSEQRAVIQKLDIAAGEISLFVRGDIQTLCDPKPNLELSVNAPLDLIGAIVGPSAPRMAGNAAVQVKLEGHLKDPTVKAQVTLAHAVFDQFDIGDATVEARYEKDLVTVEELKVAVGDGAIKGRGITIGTTGNFPLKGGVELEEIEFGKTLAKFGLTHAWVNFLVTHGEVKVSGTLNPLKLTGPAVLETKNFRVFDRAFDARNPVPMLQLDGGRIDLVAEFSPERERLRNLHIKTELSELNGDVILYPDNNKGMDLTAEFPVLDLSEFKHVVGIPWDGKFSGKATVKGPYGSRLKIDSTLTARDFKFHKLDLGNLDAEVSFAGMVLSFPKLSGVKGRSAYQAEGELDFSKPSGARSRAKLALTDARMSDVLQMIGDENWLFELLRGHLEAKVSGEAAVEGPLLQPTATIDLNFSDSTYYDRKLGAGELLLQIDEGKSLTVEKLSFDGPSGKLSYAGGMDFSGGPLDFNIDFPVMYASELAKPDGEAMHAEGTFTGKARLFGPPDHVQMEGTVYAKGIGAYGVALGDGTFALKLDGKNLSLQGPLGTDLLVDMRLNTEGDMPFAVGVSAAIANLGHYLPKQEGIRGTAEGDLLATGTIKSWDQAAGNIWVSALTIGKGDYLARNDQPIDLAFKGKAMEIRSLSLKGPTGTRLSCTGYLDEKGGLDLAVDGSFDVRLVESFTPWLEGSAGRVQVSASVAGTVDRVTVVGAADVENGKFTLHGYPVTAKGLNGRLEFSQNKVFIPELKGTLNNGQAALRGDIELKQFVPSRLDLSLLLDESQFRIPETLPTTVSGELRVQGPLTELFVTGNVDLVKARYTQDHDMEKFLSDLKRRRVEAKTFEKQSEFMRFAIDVHVLPNARVEDNLLKLAVQGDLKLVGNNARWGLLGTLTGVEGGKAFLRGNEFSLTRVQIDLTDRERIAASMDVHAESQVRDYRIYAHAWGPIEDPEVRFRSEPELADADVVTLLTLGFTSHDQSGSGGATSAGVSLVGETLFDASGLGKQLKRFIPKDGAVLKDFNFHIATMYSENTLQVEPTAQFESKFFTEALTLRLSQPVVSGKGRRAQAEYKFTKRVSAQAQWDNQSSDYSFGDLGLDLKLRWELN